MLIKLVELEKEKVKVFYYNFKDLFQDIKKYLRKNDHKCCFFLIEKNTPFSDADDELVEYNPKLLVWTREPNITIANDERVFQPMEIELIRIFPNKPYLYEKEFNKYLNDFENRVGKEITPNMNLSKMIAEMSHPFTDPNKELQRIHKEELEIEALIKKKKSLEKRLDTNTAIQTKKMKWSEYKDSNLGPPRPKRGALPGCATLRSVLLTGKQLN